MSVVPADIDTDRQPPTTIPLRHFLVALGFLLVGAALGVGIAVGAIPGQSVLAHVHLLFAGWIAITIMGAMTQFVPVWSGTQLHSKRLASLELVLVTVGLLGFATGFITNRLVLLPVFGGVMLVGFWVFVYNIGRTLLTLSSYDVTERHFAVALGFFVLVTAFGLVLALDFVHPVLVGLPITHESLLETHATLAVFGAVLTTVLGALYQLGTMFTQTDLHGIDVHIRRFEEVGYPVGVLLLAGGRLVADALLASVGGVLIAVSVLGFSVILARRLIETQVAWTPMLARYAVVAPAMAAWALFTLPAWIGRPLSRATLFGGVGAVHLLALGVIGFVVFGTLYHIVPFIVWVHRYSDRLGYEPVPMIDDLYDDRVATADFVLLVVGTATLVLSDVTTLPSVVTLVAGLLIAAGAIGFLANVLLVIRRHSPHSLAAIVVGSTTNE